MCSYRRISHHSNSKHLCTLGFKNISRNFNWSLYHHCTCLYQLTFTKKCCRKHRSLHSTRLHLWRVFFLCHGNDFYLSWKHRRIYVEIHVLILNGHCPPTTHHDIHRVHSLKSNIPDSRWKTIRSQGNSAHLQH